MNKNFSMIFLAVLFFIGSQTFLHCFENPSPEDLEIIRLLPEGKIREHCETHAHTIDVKILITMLWSAKKEEKIHSMNPVEKLAYEDVSMVFVGPLGKCSHCGSKNFMQLRSHWKNNNWMAAREVVCKMIAEMQLPLEQRYQELQGVIRTFIKLQEKSEKGLLQEKLYNNSSGNDDFRPHVAAGEE